MFLINWGELEGRTDVEFYVPSVLKYIERLKGMEHQKLLFISQKFANGSTPSEGKFEQTGVLYYRSQDIGLMEMQKKQYISEEFDEKLSRSRCRTGDVLVAIVGATLGRIGFIERDEQQGNINQNITKITISDLRFSPKFVAVFLDSKLGQIQLYRLSTKTAQSYLNNEQLGNDVISIYDSVYAHTPKRVFLARWYPDSEPNLSKAEGRLAVIKRIVEQDFGLELIDLGTKGGGTYSIRDLMYREIEASDIFIADLTSNRHNVMVEVGYAIKNVGLERMLLYFEPMDGAENPPFDLNGFRYEQIADSNDIERKVKPKLKDILDGVALGEL